MKPNNNLIAVICILLGGALTVFIFSASRKTARTNNMK